MLAYRHPTGSTRNVRVKKIFLMLIPQKKIFYHKYITLAMFTLESKVNLIFFLLNHFLVDCVVLSFLTHCLLRRFH